MTSSAAAQTSDATQRIYNFSAGPAVLPESVLKQAQAEFLSLNGMGMSILEISHRSEAFKAIHAEAQANIRKLLNVPDNYRVLFLQGGSRLQFSMIPMNLAANKKAQYFITGTWSKKSVEETKTLSNVTTEILWDGSETNFDRLPPQTAVDPDAGYVYYCSNETIHGVQFQSEPEVGDVTLVCDASSDFMYRPLPVEKYGMIYACAQKNAGPAGVTIVLIRDDLLERSDDGLPGYLNYKTHAANDSMFNTPPTFAIYMVNLVARWLLNDAGGLAAVHANNQKKAKLLYDVIDSSEGFYAGHAQADSRSLMNVTFQMANDELLAKFISAAAERNLGNLKGHRSVGGIRASIYNAMPTEGVAALAEFMQDFCNENR